MADLQATVRKLAQERVKPRAREIDGSQEYPQDLFELFRDTGLLGLVIPEEYGGSGAGILGLTVAIEEVAKYSNTAALMLLLTRLPTGPVLIAGTEEQKHHYVGAVATGAMRAGFGLSEPQAGSDVVGMRTKAQPDGDDWVLTGTKCWMSGVVQADWYCVFAKTGPADSRARLDLVLHRRAFVAGRVGRSHRPQDGRQGRRHGRARARRGAGPCRRTWSARSAGSASRCSASTRCGPSSRPAVSAWPKARSCTRSST